MEKKEFSQSPSVALIQLLMAGHLELKASQTRQLPSRPLKKYYLTPRFHSTYVTTASFTYDEVTVFVIQ